jgi:hypothetical protein
MDRVMAHNCMVDGAWAIYIIRVRACQHWVYLALEFCRADGEDVFYCFGRIVFDYFVIVVPQALEEGGEGGIAQPPLGGHFGIRATANVLMLAGGQKGEGV